MALKEQIASVALSLLLKEFGGSLKNVCLSGDFKLNHGDVTVHVNQCKLKTVV